MNNIIVTGGAGFLGSHCVDLLIEKGYDVLILDDLSFGKEENLNPNADFNGEIEVFVTDKDTSDEDISNNKSEIIVNIEPECTLEDEQKVKQD